uniref:Enhancer of split mbeta protein-like n=1 Tax=Hirondellea gigas TaxID=1518452 RepID=A0A2P2I1T8_9CRUS
MAPVVADIDVEEVEPVSRTYQYRKVMKPLLERKRRARINNCLEELKDLMVGALQSDGESITKLEKADVLELTVNHLKKLKKHNALSIPAASHTHEKFNTGFRQCTTEVSKFISSIPGIDLQISNSLLAHLTGISSQLSYTVKQSQIQSSLPNSPPPTPITVSIPGKMYTPPASPDNTRQMSPPARQQTSPPSVNSNTLQSYTVRVPPPQSQPMLVPAHVNNTNITNITYQISASSRQQQQSIHRVPQTPCNAPPSPPLSVGSPSPVHHIVRYPQVQSSSSPNTTSVSPIPHIPRPAHQQTITDAAVWRPW